MEVIGHCEGEEITLVIIIITVHVCYMKGVAKICSDLVAKCIYIHGCRSVINKLK